MASGTSVGAGSSIHIVPGVASQPIRVDNWGNFLAQRIEALYDKQEHCDLTLRFPHGDLKAHSLVLHACTPFFNNLLKGKTTGPKILKMPPQISSSAMGIILKFVYTGRLEAPFSVDMLYSTAKLLKLQILIRLLDAQMSSAEASVSARRGRPPHGFHRPRQPAAGYQPTNSQLAARRTPVRAADPPEDARPSRFELPDTDELDLRLPALEATPLRPKTEPAGTAPEALFEHLRHTPVKRQGPQENGAQTKLPKLEPADTEGDVLVLREYDEERRRRTRLLEERADDPAPDGDQQQQSQSPPNTPVTPRPILKQESTPAAASSGKKRVQFSESPPLTLTVQDMGDTSELVNQLLKQHPELLQGSQNVKVRLVTEAGQGSPSRSEFVLVKHQEQQPEQPAAPAGSPGTLDEPLSCSLCAQKGRETEFWWADQMAKHFQDEHSDASVIDLNTLSCSVCVRAGDPIDFAAVSDYLTHLRDVHDTRGVRSAGTCHLCGFSSVKKLQLIYHQYIKHKIRPPRFIMFPRCDRCDFEAISDSELMQHRQRRHKIGKEYKCKDCGLILPNLSQLEGHMRKNTCRQTSDDKRKFDWKCEFCGMSFSRSYNLKGHMRSVHKVSMEHRRVAQQERRQPAAAVKQEAAAPPLDPSSEAESLSTVANSVAASLSLAVDGGYMALSDGIVPVEDENGTISYIALRPAAGRGGDDGGGCTDAGSDGALLEVTQYALPVVVSGGAESVTIPMAPAADSGPGGSAGETVLPDLAAPEPPLSTQTSHLPQGTAPQTARTLLPGSQLQTDGRTGSQSKTPRGEQRRAVTASSGAGSSRISVSSSEVRVSELAEPGLILPHLPGEPLPAAVSQHCGPAVRLAQLQHGHIVVADGVPAGHLIVSELPSGHEVIVADMAHGQLYQLQQPASQQLNAQPEESAVISQHVGHGRLDGPDSQHSTEAAPRPVTTAQGQDTSGSALRRHRAGGAPEASTRDARAQAVLGGHGPEMRAAASSRPEEFIGPDSLDHDVNLSGMQPVEARNLAVREDNAGRANMPIQHRDQHGDGSQTDVSASGRHSVVDESVAHYPMSEETVMDSEAEESISQFPSGATVDSDERSAEVEGSAAGPGSGIAGTALSAPEAAVSPEAAAEHCRLLLVEGKEEGAPGNSRQEQQEVAARDCQQERDVAAGDYQQEREVATGGSQQELGEGDAGDCQQELAIGDRRQAHEVEVSAEDSQEEQEVAAGDCQQEQDEAEVGDSQQEQEEQVAAGESGREKEEVVAGGSRQKEEVVAGDSQQEQEVEAVAVDRPGSPSHRSQTASDPDDAWHEVLPPPPTAGSTPAGNL